MDDVTKSNAGGIVSRDAIDVLHKSMMEMPQAPGMDTRHFFAGGMYCRRMEIPAGTAIVSKVHKTEHLFIGCQGALAVSGQGENYVLTPGDVVPSVIGTKRAVYAINDVICMTVHRTEKMSTDGLEDEMMVVDEMSLYDVNNNPKHGVIVGDTAAPLLWEGK